MTTLVKQNLAQIGNLIKARHEKEFDGNTMFDDFCAIGSFLTDEAACMRHLTTLNDALVQHAEQRGVLSKMTTFKLVGQSHTLKSHGKATDDFGDKYTIHKHHKVLSSFLETFEGQHGFNTGRLPIELADDELPAQLPARAPALVAFVSAADFRKYLFQYGYHWKDAGVGWKHGEFTHRIHWYMVLEELRTQPNWLRNEPLDLFRACALPLWRHAKATDKGVWDDVFDDLPSKDSFRSPETLHKFLKDAADPKDPNHKPLWFLSQLILGRAAKRLAEKKDSFEVPDDAVTAAGKLIMWKPVG